jgi:CheY-like chemotaxis protein
MLLTIQKEKSGVIESTESEKSLRYRHRWAKGETMSETGTFRIALLPCGATQWSDAIVPLLRSHATCLDVVETAEELLSVPSHNRPEIIFVCHQPGIHDGIATADLLRTSLLFTPLVLLAFENNTTLKSALTIGATAIVEPPFAEKSVLAALERCRRPAEALREKTMSETLVEPQNILDEFDELLLMPDTTLLSKEVSSPSASIGDPEDADGTDGTVNPLATMKILVAEDLPAQQAVIRQQLELIGCQAVIVDNGGAAVAAFESGSFDAILMDLNMPVMDGFKAAHLIREKEQLSGGRIPMVALTSYSVKEILDTCLRIGMDGYLVKPVATRKLEATLLHLKKPEDASAQLGSLTAGLNGVPVLEVEAILEKMDSNVDLYREMIEIYLTNYSGLGDELAELLSDGSLQEMSTTARSLEAIVANIGGARLGKVAGLIQEMCHEGKIPLITLWMPVVSAESAALKAALQDIDCDALHLNVTENIRSKINQKEEPREHF